MRVSEVMTKPAISVAPDALLSDVIDIMTKNRLSGVPVVNSDGSVVGIVSEGDLLRRIELGTAQANEGFWTKIFAGADSADRYRRAKGRRARDVMSDNPVTINERDTLADAARLMETFKVKRLPVIQQGALAGMLTRADFVKALGRFVAAEDEGATLSDDAIVSNIEAEIARQAWSASCTATVACENGVVTLGGYAPNETQRQAMIVAAETARGVRSVTDRIEVFTPQPFAGY